MIDGTQAFWIEGCSDNASRWQVLRYWYRLGRMLHRMRDDFDVLQVHATAFLPSAAVAFSSFLGKPVLVRSSISGEFRNLHGSLSGRTQRFMLKQADAFVVLSERLAEEFLRSGLPASRLYHIPNGVDPSLYHPVDENEKRSLRRELGLPERGRILVYHGVFIERKSLRWLVDALGSYLERLDVHLLLVGGPAREDSETGYSQALDRQIRDSPGQERIHVREFRPDVHRYLKAADLYVLPSTGEGLSNALLEAMSVGLVPLVSKAGGSEDVVEDGVSGFVFESRSYSEFEKILHRCLGPSSQVDLKLLSRQAHERVQPRFSIQATADQYIRVFESVLNSKGKQTEDDQALSRS
jgi:glycosyltransferase involved in cell wall biosynthesis